MRHLAAVFRIEDLTYDKYLILYEIPLVKSQYTVKIAHGVMTLVNS